MNSTSICWPQGTVVLCTYVGRNLHSLAVLTVADSTFFLSPHERTTDWDFLVATDPLLYFNSPSHSLVMYSYSYSTIRLCTLNCTFAQVTVKFP